jgi:hypothetical protein
VTYTVCVLNRVSLRRVVISEEHVARLHRTLHSLATSVPVIIPHRAEDIFPALKTSLVILLVMFSAKYICSFYQIPVMVAVMEVLCTKPASTEHTQSIFLVLFIIHLFVYGSQNAGLQILSRLCT